MLQLTKFNNKIKFENALYAAVKSFLNNDDDNASPLAILINDGFEKEEAKKVLYKYLNQPTTKLTLVDILGGFASHPEHGESISENWAFFLYIDTCELKYFL